MFLLTVLALAPRQDAPPVGAHTRTKDQADEGRRLNLGPGRPCRDPASTRRPPVTHTQGVDTWGLRWLDQADGPAVVLLDQTRLPAEETYLTCTDVASLVDAIDVQM